MHILRDHTSCPERLKDSVLAIGNFDGVHRGHQAVLSAAVERARGRGVAAGAMTFEPHPRQFFQPDTPLFRLTPPALKLRLIEKLGLDAAVVLDFNADLAGLPAADFARQVLVEGLGVSHVVTGYDFHFGKGRDGNPEVLKALGRDLGFGVSVVGPVEEGGEAFSSSRVRAHLRAGEPEAAARLLGYWWRLSGVVVGGAGRGTGLGVPTANLDVAEGMGLRHGIYAVRAFVNGGRHEGVAYFGTRPTFGAGNPQVEAYLFDFDGDLYEHEIEIEVVAWVRGDETFATERALVAQMERDVAAAKAALAALSRRDPILEFPLARALTD